MKQLIQDALAEGVSLEKLFMTYVPRAHELQREMFSRVSAVPLVLSFWFEDIDERYSYEFGASGVEVEHGELVDFPLVTIVLRHDQWEQVRPRLREMLCTLQDHKDQLEQKYVREPISAHVKEAFEGLHGTIHVNVEGIKLKVILNDYVEEYGGSSFEVALTHELLEGVVSGAVSPREMASKVKVSGQMGFALELAAFFNKYFNV